MTRSKRVVIIGAGATGALCAYSAAQAGFDVVVLEKKFIGNGSSSRSAACIRAQFGTPETVMGMLYAEHFFESFHDYLETPNDELREPVIIQNGYLFLFENPEHAADHEAATDIWENAQRDVTMQQKLGLEVEQLSADDVMKRWKHIDPQPRDLLVGATWCARDGFLIPDLVYNVGIASAERLGARLHLYHEVTGGRLAGGRLLSVETVDENGEKKSYEADVFVNATNAWAPRVSRRLGGMDLAIAPLKRYLWWFTRNEGAAPPDLVARWKQLPMTIYGLGGRRGVYSRPHFSDSELVIGHADEHAKPEPDFTDGDQDTWPQEFDHRWTGDGEYTALDALQQIAEFSPILADCGGYSHTTSGYYGTTPDHNPLIGVDANLSNLIHAAGFSGHGLMHAPVSAALVTALLESEGRARAAALPAPFDHHEIAFGRFDPKRDFGASAAEKRVI
jgi:sarcosine oxidase subunit beta